MGIYSSSTITFEQIAAKLNNRECDDGLPEEKRTRAAVAMILHQTADDLDVLFIQRAASAGDPWSGHIAFPGGKLERGEQVCQTAKRETREEIGVDLHQARYLGRLSDIVGANLPVRVSCCLYAIDRTLCTPELNHEEVHELFWVSLADLTAPGRHHICSVSFGDKRFDVPAIRLPLDDKPVLWGITYRLVLQFMELLNPVGAVAGQNTILPAMVEISEEVEHV